MSSNPTEEQFLKDLFEIFGDRVPKFNPELYDHLKAVWSRGRDFERSQSPIQAPILPEPPAPGNLVLSRMEYTSYSPVYMDEHTGNLVAVNKIDPSRGLQRIEHRQMLKGNTYHWYSPSGEGPPAYQPVEIYVNGELADPNKYELVTEGSSPLVTYGVTFKRSYSSNTCVELRWCELKDIYVV